MIERLKSGIDELDSLLHGGLPSHAINLIIGPPGTGKSMLAQHYVFTNASSERPAVYFSTVSEPFEKIVRYGQTLDFFDSAMVGRAIFFEDLAGSLEEGGLPAVLDRIDAVMRERRVGILVIDSFKPFSAYAPGMKEFRSFMHGLAARLSVLDISTFWLGEYDAAERAGTPEFAVADSVIALESTHARQRTSRELRILKLRGSGFASGAHAYRISAAGIEVFPRLADPVDTQLYQFDSGRTSSGIEALDEMLTDGYVHGTSTICAGPTGTGKTLLGLHFIFKGAQLGEHGLIATLQENPSQLERVAEGFGWSLSNDAVHCLYRSPVDLYIDEWVYDLLRAVERTNSRRVLIDSLSDIAFAAEDEQRFREYIYSLIQRLSRQGISLFMTSELPDVFGVAGVTPAGAGSLCDNIMLLQYTTREDAVRRTLTVLKTRASAHHEQVRDFEIDQRGISLTAR